MDAHLRVHKRLHWRDVDLGIHLLLLITEIAPEPVSSRILHTMIPMLICTGE